MAKKKGNKKSDVYFASGSLAVFLLLINIFFWRSGIIDVAVILIIVTTTLWLKQADQKMGQ